MTSPTRPRRHLSGLLALVATLAAAVSTLAATVAVPLPAAAFEGAPWFEPGKPYDQNFPDPAIIKVDGKYYAYATTTGGAALPVMTSRDLVHWKARGDALGPGPSWSPQEASGLTNLWAPSVVELPDGSFMAAFAARTGSGERRCIGTAYASSPLGPFDASSSTPFVCEPDPNGAIDPFLVVDEEGVPWLIWKNEGVPVGHPTLDSRRTAFWSRQLSDDGRSWRPGSTVHFLLETTELARPWQGTVIENPALILHEGTWLLLYSANEWDSADYAMGFAICSGPAGPCTEPGTTPVVTSSDTILGPGAPAPIIGPDGLLWVGYQGWNAPYTNYPDYPACDTDGDEECADAGQRFLHVERLCISGAVGFLYEADGRIFCDVAPDSYYGEAVTWLRDQELTTGVTPTVYGSDLPVSRAQMATFLWRLMGRPAPDAAAPFVDVPPGRYYSDAVAWLAEQGITTGVTPDRFDPDGLVNRAQMATFLWRLMSSPTGASSPPFTDVPAGRYFTAAVAWLFDRGITTGTTATTYSPDEPVSRAQMAAFLCRLTRTGDYTESGAPTCAC